MSTSSSEKGDDTHRDDPEALDDEDIDKPQDYETMYRDLMDRFRKVRWCVSASQSYLCMCVDNGSPFDH